MTTLHDNLRYLSRWVIGPSLKKVSMYFYRWDGEKKTAQWRDTGCRLYHIVKRKQRKEQTNTSPQRNLSDVLDAGEIRSSEPPNAWPCQSTPILNRSETTKKTGLLVVFGTFQPPSQLPCKIQSILFTRSLHCHMHVLSDAHKAIQTN